MRDKIENIVADYKRKVQHLENDMVNELCDLHIVRGKNKKRNYLQLLYGT